MRKDTINAKLTEIEKERNKQISKKRYVRFQPGGLPGRRVEQYFGLSHLHDGLRLGEARSSASESAYRARFTTIIKNIWDVYDSEDWNLESDVQADLSREMQSIFLWDGI